jgi:hypothetical protein
MVLIPVSGVVQFLGAPGSPGRGVARTCPCHPARELARDQERGHGGQPSASLLRRGRFG